MACRQLNNSRNNGKEFGDNVVQNGVLTPINPRRNSVMSFRNLIFAGPHMDLM
jgi:hypothetical protein